MRYLALVTDYDGTLTQDDRLADTTAAALGRLRASLRRVILVTGRRIFFQIGEGVDDETWLYHLQRGDYSRWLRDLIKDPRLAEIVAGIEREWNLPPAHSRRLVCDAIPARYTLPE